MQSRTLILSSVFLAIGLACAGWFAGQGILHARTAERYVTVKGLSERPARAELALWPLRLSVSDNDLARGHAKMATNVRLIRAFLVRHGIDTSGVALQDFVVNDAFANQYQNDRVANRYVIRQTVMVRSTEPEKVLVASQSIGELVEAGVVFSSGNEYGGGGPTFLFKGLSELKTAMIAEATVEARAAAEQFARDSKSQIAGIRRANQGLFQILARDEASGVREENQIDKTIRVVTTVEYFLK